MPKIIMCSKSFRMLRPNVAYFELQSWFKQSNLEGLHLGSARYKVFLSRGIKMFLQKGNIQAVWMGGHGDTKCSTSTL